MGGLGSHWGHVDGGVQAVDITEDRLESIIDDVVCGFDRVEEVGDLDIEMMRDSGSIPTGAGGSDVGALAAFCFHFFSLFEAAIVRKILLNSFLVIARRISTSQMCCSLHYVWPLSLAIGIERLSRASSSHMLPDVPSFLSFLCSGGPPTLPRSIFPVCRRGAHGRLFRGHIECRKL